MSTASQALSQLNPEVWENTNIIRRIKLLKSIQKNLIKYAHELGLSDMQMKNSLMEEELFSYNVSKMGTVVPLGNTVTACIDLYQSLSKNRMLKPAQIKAVDENLWDIHVRRPTLIQQLAYGSNKEVLRVKGKPRQINPMDKPVRVIAVLGAGNYSSALEVITALFLENSVVVHKPHQLNVASDAIWEKVLEPLVKIGVLSFTNHDQGQQLTADSRVHKIYFTGGSKTAQAIERHSKAEVVSECGGNNPCIIVPGDRPWTKKEITHQAQFIVSIGKLNGGAACGRPQTIITSKKWPQRQELISAIRQAIFDTPASGTYYPGSERVKQNFIDAYAHAETLKSNNCKNTDVILIEDIDPESYGIQHEAFCQVFTEIGLDVDANAEDFLPEAVKFSNQKLLGTLACAIIIDEETQKTHQKVLDQAVTDLAYGAITINEMPPTIWLSPYLTWGGNELNQPLVSGRGNFGNILNFENVEKSILIGSFLSPGHLIVKNQRAFDDLAQAATDFSINPGWMNLMKLIKSIMFGPLKTRGVLFRFKQKHSSHPTFSRS